MKDHHVSSFDLRLSGQLARRLSGRGSTAKADAAAPEYCRFSVERISAKAPPQAVSEEPKIRLDPEGYYSWDELLSWCMATYTGRSAMVVSPDGFVIAYAGAEPAAGFEDLGAELSATVHQMGRCGESFDDDAVSWFSLEYTSSWLNGISIKAASGSAFIFAVISEGPSSKPVRQATTKQIRYSLRHLD